MTDDGWGWLPRPASSVAGRPASPWHFPGSQTSIFVDIGGHGGADMQIRLTGTITLHASDFIL